MIAEILVWVVLVIAAIGALTVTKALLTERRRNQLVFFSALAIVTRELGDQISLPPLLQIEVAENLREEATLFIISAVFMAYVLRLFSEGTSAISRSAALPPDDKTVGARIFVNLVLSPFSLLIDVVGPVLITVLALNGDIEGAIEVWRNVTNFLIGSLKEISIQEANEQASPLILLIIDETLQFIGSGIERVIGRFIDLPNQIRSLQ